MNGNEFYIMLVMLGLALIGLIILICVNRGLNREVNAMVKAYERLADKVEQSDNEDQLMVQTVQSTVKAFGDMISQNQRDMATAVERRLSVSQEVVDKRLQEMNTRISEMSRENGEKLEVIRQTTETRIQNLTEENTRQLDKMRETVDEKLQKTLEDRIGQSFKLVSERLEQVYEGLGEMKTLANGVGDLKKVLSNVKTRGILGEVQLGAILEQILPAEQYEENVATRPGSGERVEFAIRLPGEGSAPVYLPIDSKFPGERYAAYRDAYESGDKELTEKMWKHLEAVLKSEARDIQDKYIAPPYTTEFGIMFLPFEGLYADVVNRGMVEVLQRDYKINIAGPTTMAAFLNSLQMGFRTLAIQKHSGEVWEVLGAVKKEFRTFSEVLQKTRNQLRLADDNLDKLVGTRTRAIERKLRSVETLEGSADEDVLDPELIEEPDEMGE